MTAAAKQRAENEIERRDRELEQTLKSKVTEITAALHHQLETFDADRRALEERAMRETSIEYRYVIETRGEISHRPVTIPGAAAYVIGLALSIARMARADRCTVTRLPGRIRSSEAPYPILEIDERVIWIEELHREKRFPVSGRDRAAGEVAS